MKDMSLRIHSHSLHLHKLLIQLCFLSRHIEWAIRRLYGITIIVFPKNGRRYSLLSDYRANRDNGQLLEKQMDSIVSCMSSSTTWTLCSVLISSGCAGSAMSFVWRRMFRRDGYLMRGSAEVGEEDDLASVGKTNDQRSTINRN